MKGGERQTHVGRIDERVDGRDDEEPLVDGRRGREYDEEADAR